MVYLQWVPYAADQYVTTLHADWAVYCRFKRANYGNLSPNESYSCRQTTVFSLTLARSPMASRSYRRASDFLNYSPGLASDILAERKREKKEKKFFFF